MHFFPQGLIVMLLFGVVIAVISALKIMNENNNDENLQVNNAINALNIATKEADDAMNELDKFSKTVFLEMENKYQEILYLYSSLEEKKQEILTFKKDELHKSEGHNNLDNLKTKFKNLNPKSQEIMKLYTDGLGASEIAKDLKMGIGEVKLIIELVRDR